MKLLQKKDSLSLPRLVGAACIEHYCVFIIVHVHCTVAKYISARQLFFDFEQELLWQYKYMYVYEVISARILLTFSYFSYTYNLFNTQFIVSIIQ